MSRYTKIFYISAITLMIASLSGVASAQWRTQKDNRNNNQYGVNTYNLQSTIRNLRNRAGRFQDALDRELDQSRYDGSRREDHLNKLAKSFEKAVKKLDDEYDNQNDFNRSADEARKVLSVGSQLDRALTSSRLNRNRALSNNWNTIERDLQTISRAYNSNSYGTNNRGNNNRNNNQRYDQNLRGTIISLRNKSSQFENRLDKIDDKKKSKRRGAYVGNLENLSDRFNDAAKDLEKAYRKQRNSNSSYDEAQRVLNIGRQIDGQIARRGVSKNIKNQWRSIKKDLDKIARAYNNRNRRGY